MFKSVRDLEAMTTVQYEAYINDLVKRAMVAGETERQSILAWFTQERSRVTAEAWVVGYSGDDLDRMARELRDRGVTARDLDLMFPRKGE